MGWVAISYFLALKIERLRPGGSRKRLGEIAIRGEGKARQNAGNPTLQASRKSPNIFP